MLLTETQLSIYEDSKRFIFIRLNNVLNRSKADPMALRAFFFQLKVTLKYDKKYSDYIGETFYSDHSNIRRFFSKLSDLLNNNAPGHPFITSLSDPRLFSQKNKEDSENISREFSVKLKQDLTQWFNAELKKTTLTGMDMITLHNKYYALYNPQQDKVAQYK